MEILALSRRICVLCGFCSPEESDLREELCQLLNIMFILFNLVIMEIAFAMHALLALKLNNMVDLLFDFLQLTANMSLLLSYISIVYQRRNMKRFFNRLQTIFDQCKFQANIRSIEKFREYLNDRYFFASILILNNNSKFFNNSTLPNQPIAAEFLVLSGHQKKSPFCSISAFSMAISSSVLVSNRLCGSGLFK